MKRTLIIIAALCCCGLCHAQSADLVIDATEAREFRQAFIDYANANLAGAADLLFLTAAGAAIPTGTKTVTVNQAQSNRWFKTAKGSFYSDSTWAIGRLSVASKKFPRLEVYSSVVSQATERMPNIAARNRFRARLDYLKSPDSE